MYTVIVKKVPSRWNPNPNYLFFEGVKTKRQIADLKRKYQDMEYYELCVEQADGCRTKYLKTLAEKWRVCK